MHPAGRVGASARWTFAVGGSVDIRALGIRALTLAVLLVGAAVLMPRAATADGTGSQAGPPADARAHLQQIMDDPLFQRWERRQLRAEERNGALLARFGELMRQAGDYVRRFVRWLFTRDRGGGGASDGATLATMMRWLGWVLAAVLVGLVVWTIVRLLRERGQREQAVVLSRARLREALETGEALAVDSGGWLAEADRLAAMEDLRLAYRATYLSLLSGLHQRRRIDFRQHRTNWTYVNQYRGPDAERGTFAELTAVFDEAWYGHRQIDRSTFDRVRQRVREMVG